MSRKMAVGVLLAAVIVAPAISPAADFSKGVKVGLNLSTLTGADSAIEGASKSMRIGVAGGVFGSMAIPKAPLAVELDALYSMKGAKYKSGGETATAQYDYLDIPLLLRYEAQAAPTRVSVYAGPSLGVLLNSTFATEAGDVDLADFTASTDLGLVIGAGVGLSSGVTAEVRYAFGLTTISEPPADSADEKVYNGVLQIMVGYSF